MKILHDSLRDKRKVFVGMSGGVDSSVSAALLKKAGYDVTGVFIKVWQPDWLTCNWKEDRLDAMRASAHIGIPFVTLDLENEYKQGVIDYMLAEYSAGRTPNPDVMCNREVKFGAFWKWAKSQGASFIATGHYGRIKNQESGIIGASKENMPLRGALGGREGGREAAAPPAGGDGGPRWGMFSGEATIIHKLLTGLDPNKDQSYFLWTLKQEDLNHIIFPVGHLQKSEVRKLAREFALPNAEKKDSQGLCFVGKIDFKEFLSHYIKTKAGNVLNMAGEKIGHHPGAFFFTLGERHGFTVTKKSPNDLPYYVISKDIKQNTITIDTNKLVNSKNTIIIANCNWISRTPKIGDVVFIRTRYRQPLIQAIIESLDNDKAILKIDKPIDPVTPGQSLVAYLDEECLGGGIIQV